MKKNSELRENDKWEWLKIVLAYCILRVHIAINAFRNLFTIIITIEVTNSRNNECHH